MSDARPVVYVVGFSAPPVLHLHELIALLLDEGWDPWVILSPVAASWADLEQLGRVSGHTVRVEPRTPSEQDPLPPASAIVAAPLTFNSLNKWAAGINDTLALGLLNEAIGIGTPITAALCVKDHLRCHPAYAFSESTLRKAGVTVLRPEDIVIRSETGTASLHWPTALAALRQSKLSLD